MALPTGFMGSGFDFGNAGPAGNWFGAGPTALAPNVAATFATQPQAYWNTARLAQMGDYAGLPQFQRAANLGFTPAFGQYLMSGSPAEFSAYGGMQSADERAAAWQNAITASGHAGNPNAVLTNAQRNILGNLQGEDARRNALAIAAAGMGGGVGYTADARQRALGNMYDLYSARAAAAGGTPAGFLNYLSTRMA